MCLNRKEKDIFCFIRNIEKTDTLTSIWFHKYYFESPLSRSSQSVFSVYILNM